MRSITKFLDVHFHPLALLLAGGCIMFVFAKLYFEWMHRIKTTEKESAKLNTLVIPKLGQIDNSILSIEKVSSKIDTYILPKLTHMDNNIMYMNESILSLKQSFNRLVVYLKAKDKQLDTSLFNTKSPIQLSSLAERILNATGGKEYIDKNIDALINKRDTNAIKTALDAQIQAPSVINKVSGDVAFKKIKDYIYESPLYKEGKGDAEISVPLDLDVVAKNMGIYLRDAYLKIHAHLNPVEMMS